MIELSIATDAEILEVFHNDVIWNAVASDKAPSKEDWEIQRDGEYIACKVNDVLIGVAVHHDVSGEAQIHFQVLPQYRKYYAKAFLNAFLNYLFDELRYEKVIAEIPAAYPNVLIFALKNGFSITGMADHTFKKNGIDHAVYEVALER